MRPRIYNFDECYIPEPNSGCWIWTGPVNRDGYGRWWTGKDRIGAHREAWMRWRSRTIPKGMSVLHKCDVRCCINPDHLFLGTQLDNIEDMRKKGRAKSKGRPGILHHNNILSERDVMAARSMRASGMLLREIGEKMGVNRATIGDAVSGRTWSHLK